ncbi:hypothetical protein ACQP00_24460 [Dactylosporangium sp. CS-047395]|uniref:hypothetical protein n=1 Tax=Dactylosporangium sp. CS-047395 TaxID=3239936 RepID=UPI003D93A0A9
MFTSSPARLAAYFAVAAVGVWLSVALVFGTVSALVGGSIGRAAGFWLDPRALLVAGLALVVPFVRMVRRPYWVTLSPDGVAIGAGNRRTVLLPREGVESATVHGRSVFATVHVVLRGNTFAVEEPGPGRPPVTRVCDGRFGYQIPAGLFPGGAEMVLARLRAEGVPVAG